MSAPLLEHLERERPRLLAELTELIAFPSVSALPEHAPDLRRCADWLVARLTTIGLEHVGLHETGGHPIVYGDWLHAGPDAPTVLLYGHYDVQPADPLELWTTPPFVADVRDGRLYGRGASDDKGMVLIALHAIEALLTLEGALPCNVKLLIEGEEEVRADHLDRFVGAQAELLAADVFVNSDNTMLAPGVPALPLGLRGLVALEIGVRTAETDLHSGAFGGVAPNALSVLSALLASLHDADGRVAVDGFYDDVLPVDPDDLAAWAALPLDEDELRREAGLNALVGDPDHGVRARQWSRPTLDLHGISGGFGGTGVKTVIPAAASAKLSCRLVPGQDADVIAARIEAHLRRRAPDYAELTCEVQLWSPAILVDERLPAIAAAEAAVTTAFGRPPVRCRAPWSIPVCEIVQRHLGLDPLLLGFALPTDRQHAPDEHLRLETLTPAIHATVELLRELAAAARPGDESGASPSAASAGTA